VSEARRSEFIRDPTLPRKRAHGSENRRQPEVFSTTHVCGSENSHLTTEAQPRITMPYLMIQTNLPLGKKAERAILRNASTLIAELLEKPESFVMIALETDTPMLFAGSDDAVAFLELKSIGLSARKTKDLSQALCQLIEGHLGIAKDRVYVKFIDVKGSMWGWKGDTF
jgi:phenylpyruvate tautomerase